MKWGVYYNHGHASDDLTQVRELGEFDTEDKALAAIPKRAKAMGLREDDYSVRPLVAGGASGGQLVSPAPTVLTDAINSPAHYKSGGMEVIDVIEAFGYDKNAYRANTLKYALRAGKKDPAKTVEDLKKARWYLEREIAKLEAK